jgi:hypothetical protein
MKGRIVFVRFRGNGDAEERKSAVLSSSTTLGSLFMLIAFVCTKKQDRS